LARKLGIEAIIIGQDRRIHMTAGISGRFTLSDANYSVVNP